MSFFFNFVNNNEQLNKTQVWINFIKQGDLDKDFLDNDEHFFEASESKKFNSRNSQIVGWFKKIVKKESSIDEVKQKTHIVTEIERNLKKRIINYLQTKSYISAALVSIVIKLYLIYDYIEKAIIRYDKQL